MDIIPIFPVVIKAADIIRIRKCNIIVAMARRNRLLQQLDDMNLTVNLTPQKHPDWFKLKFTGFGCATQPQFGTNSAYMKLPNGGMLLFECGSLTYRRLKDNKDFQNAKWLTIVMSHTHDDHCGSLGITVMEYYHAHKMPVNIIYCGRIQRQLLSQLLDTFGVPPEYYNLLSIKQTNINDLIHLLVFGDMCLWMDFDRTKHVPEIPCYSIVLRYVLDDHDNDAIYWSGDTSSLVGARVHLQVSAWSQIYHEVARNAGPAHTSLDALDETYQTLAKGDARKLLDYRRRTTIMHIDCLEVARHARELGYQLPDIMAAELDR